MWHHSKNDNVLNIIRIEQSKTSEQALADEQPIISIFDCQKYDQNVCEYQEHACPGIPLDKTKKKVSLTGANRSIQDNDMLCTHSTLIERPI